MEKKQRSRRHPQQDQSERRSEEVHKVISTPQPNETRRFSAGFTFFSRHNARIRCTDDKAVADCKTKDAKAIADCKTKDDKAVADCKVKEEHAGTHDEVVADEKAVGDCKVKNAKAVSDCKAKDAKAAEDVKAKDAARISKVNENKTPPVKAGGVFRAI